MKATLSEDDSHERIITNSHRKNDTNAAENTEWIALIFKIWKDTKIGE